MIKHRVKTEGFEGPLDLLLRLVDREELDITRLSLAKVADDFLAEIDKGKIDLAEMAEFLLVASQLILIKSKALLPLFQFTPEEEAEIGDLEERLREYRAFKKAAGVLQKKMAIKKIFFSREGWKREKLGVRFVNPNLSGEDLSFYWRGILERNQPKEKLEERVLQEVITLENRIDYLRNSLESRIKICFRESVRGAKNKIEVIVTFLAMLELVKRRIIVARQTEVFGDILLEKVKE